VRLDETHADGAVGLHGAELRREQKVAHEREDAVLRARCLSEEIWNEREFGFDAEHASDRTYTNAPIEVLVLTVRDRWTTRVTAEVVADERADEAVCAGRCCTSAGDGTAPLALRRGALEGERPVTRKSLLIPPPAPATGVPLRFRRSAARPLEHVQLTHIRVCRMTLNVHEPPKN
jgi:hypothetical protein